jgi:hypothetical protein
MMAIERQRPALAVRLSLVSIERPAPKSYGELVLVVTTGVTPGLSLNHTLVVLIRVQSSDIGMKTRYEDNLRLSALRS